MDALTAACSKARKTGVQKKNTDQASRWPRSRQMENEYFRRKYGIPLSHKGAVHPNMAPDPSATLDLATPTFHCAFCLQSTVKVWRGKENCFICRRCEFFGGKSKKW